mmetsp:Transcript_30992/g.104354  ORF Transcript_30992/g.104354 Transcript_30992/m.104354 type:complete len:217 (+) Transcript_30992:3361-4011(+)
MRVTVSLYRPWSSKLTLFDKCTSTEASCTVKANSLLGVILMGMPCSDTSSKRHVTATLGVKGTSPRMPQRESATKRSAFGTAVTKAYAASVVRGTIQRLRALQARVRSCIEVYSFSPSPYIRAAGVAPSRTVYPCNDHVARSGPSMAGASWMWTLPSNGASPRLKTRAASSGAVAPTTTKCRCGALRTSSLAHERSISNFSSSISSQHFDCAARTS